MIIGTVIFNKYSLKVGVVVGITIGVLGTGLMAMTNIHWYFMPIGSAIYSLAAPIVLISPSAFAVTWFEEGKRVLAIAILVSSGFFGVAFGYAFTEIMIDSQSPSYTTRYHSVELVFTSQALIGVCVWLITMLTFKSKPPRPPSAFATVYRDDDILGTYRELFKNRNFMLLMGSHCFYQVMLVAMILNMSYIAEPYGFDLKKVDNIQIVNVS